MYTSRPFFVVLSGLLLLLGVVGEEARQPLTIVSPLEHSLDGVSFQPRGQVTIRLADGDSFRHPDTHPKTPFGTPDRYSLSFTQTTLTSDDISRLETLADNGGMYRIRIRIPKIGGTQRKILGSIPACSLIASKFVDNIVMHVDVRGTLIALNYTVPVNECPPSSERSKIPPQTSYTTSVSLEEGTPGAPVMKKTEDQLKAESEAEGKKDNRSFFMKYWYYILPAVLFMVLGGAPEEEASTSEGSASTSGGSSTRATASSSNGGGGRRRRR